MLPIRTLQKVLITAFCALSLLFHLCPQATAQNLVTNGGFESALKDWTNANPSVVEVTKGDVIKGNAAEGENYIAIQSPDAKEKTMRRVITGLTAGQEYTLAVKTRKNTITELRIVVRNTTSKSYVGMIKPLSSWDWILAKCTFKSPGTEIGLEISARSPGGCDLDDIQIVPGKGDSLAKTSPSSFSSPSPASSPAKPVWRRSPRPRNRGSRSPATSPPPAARGAGAGRGGRRRSATPPCPKPSPAASGRTSRRSGSAAPPGSN